MVLYANINAFWYSKQIFLLNQRFQPVLKLTSSFLEYYLRLRVLIKYKVLSTEIKLHTKIKMLFDCSFDLDIKVLIREKGLLL